MRGEGLWRLAGGLLARRGGGPQLMPFTPVQFSGHYMCHTSAPALPQIWGGRRFNFCVCFATTQIQLCGFGLSLMAVKNELPRHGQLPATSRRAVRCLSPLLSLSSWSVSFKTPAFHRVLEFLMLSCCLWQRTCLVPRAWPSPSMSFLATRCPGLPHICPCTLLRASSYVWTRPPTPIFWTGHCLQPTPEIMGNITCKSDRRAGQAQVWEGGRTAT